MPIAKWTAVVLVSAGVTAAGLVEYQRRAPRAASTGSFSVETVPAGLDVTIGGKVVGTTPLTLSLAPGPYEVQLGQGAAGRTIKVAIAAGASVVQHVELPVIAEASVTWGALRIQTDPPHLPVSVDGIEHGLSPVTLEKIQAGDHEVTVRGSGGAIRRSVAVPAQETVSLIVSSAMAAAEPGAIAAGWLSISSSVPLQLKEGGRVIGTTESDRVMLTAGDHDLDIVNAALGFSAQRTFHVTSGKTTVARIDVPNGTLSLNASPWAEVFVDGERIGETPIGNLSRPIGRHEVIFRHPQLGEHREVVIVTANGPTRLGVDLRKK
jgi:hypothetical protein